MIVQIENLVKRYGNKVVLDHINLEVEDGEIFGLLGPSGAGKTTTINCLLSLLNYDKGRVSIFGVDMRPNSYDIKRNIGVVMQEIAVFEELTVYENVAYFGSLYLRDKELVDQYAKDALQKTNLMSYANYYPKKLSEGLLRRLNIACGIVHKPKLLIMDEPTSGTDPKNRKSLLSEFKRMNAEGTTIIYTTHYMEEAEELCSKIAILDQGKIITQGTKQELKSMISLGERISIEVYQLTREQIQGIREINNVYSVDYKDHILEIKSSKGKNNLLHIMTYLTEHNITMGKVFTELPTLNDVFLEITGNDIVK